MDEIVKAALRKWPHVPACRGWLALDARGDWYMRDDRVQRAGPFPRVKGSAIRHDKLREFIERNYECDSQGCWYFQNGPQRVYVELEAAPWIWRVRWLGGRAEVASHSGLPTRSEGAYIDEHGRLFLQTGLGFGIVHPQDMVDAAEAVDTGLWHPREMPFAQMPLHFGYVLSPQAADAAGVAQAAPPA